MCRVPLNTMLSFLFFTFLFYVLFKLVFDFVIPIYKTTKKVKQSFRNIQQQMHEQQNGPAAYQSSANGKTKTKQQPSGDYIDFEEVKE
jgi:hypothetical protein